MDWIGLGGWTRCHWRRHGDGLLSSGMVGEVLFEQCSGSSGRISSRRGGGGGDMEKEWEVGKLSGGHAVKQGAHAESAGGGRI